MTLEIPSVCSGQGAEGRRRYDLEAGRELGQSARRQLGRPGGELEKTAKFLGAEIRNGDPEPGQDFAELARRAHHVDVVPQLVDGVLAGAACQQLIRFTRGFDLIVDYLSTFQQGEGGGFVGNVGDVPPARSRRRC